MKPITLVLCVGLASSGAITTAHAAPISGQGTWETTLQGRDLDGDFSNGFEAYYDTVLNITWLADANHAYTSGYQTLNNGRMDWAAANAWAAGLNIHGVTGWRLPETNPVNGASYNYSFAYDGMTDWGYNISLPGTAYAGGAGSEMAHMFYNTLGNLSVYDTSGNFNQPGWGLTNTGPFSYIHPSVYWSATGFAPVTDTSWSFSFNSAGQFNIVNSTSFYAWAVYDGDISALNSEVPVPAAAWLFGSGLLGLVGMSRRRRCC